MKRFSVFLTAVLLLTAVLALTASAADDIPGDLNADGFVDVLDAALLLQNSIFPERYPISYPGSLDFDHDGNVDIRDAVRLIQYSLYPEVYPIEQSVPEILQFISNGDGTCTVRWSGEVTDEDIIIPQTGPTGETVAAIDREAFRNCASLTVIVIPDTVTEIGASAFSGCTALREIYYAGTDTQWMGIRKAWDWDSGSGAYILHSFKNDKPGRGEYDLD